MAAFPQTGVCKLEDEGGGVVIDWEVASVRMHVSRTTRKVRPRASQCPRPSLGFDERSHSHKREGLFIGSDRPSRRVNTAERARGLHEWTMEVCRA